MKNIIKHGKFTHIRTCPNCNCIFTYFDDGGRGDDIEYDWDYVGDKKNWSNFKFVQKRIYCPECGYEIDIKAENVDADDKNTLLINQENNNIFDYE